MQTESLNELEDHDLDALVADLGSKSTPQEFSTYQQNSTLADKQTAPPTMTQGFEPAAALSPPANNESSKKVLHMVIQNLPAIIKINMFLNMKKMHIHLYININNYRRNPRQRRIKLN